MTLRVRIGRVQITLISLHFAFSRIVSKSNCIDLAIANKSANVIVKPRFDKHWGFMVRIRNCDVVISVRPNTTCDIDWMWNNSWKKKPHRSNSEKRIEESKNSNWAFCWPFKYARLRTADSFFSVLFSLHYFTKKNWCFRKWPALVSRIISSNYDEQFTAGEKPWSIRSHLSRKEKKQAKKNVQFSVVIQ